MSDGPSMLEQRIAHFEELLEQMKAETREAHSVLKQIRNERKEVERLMSTNAKDMVERRVDEVVGKELEKIGPEVRKQTSLIYSKVGKEIDKIIDICLGKEYSQINGREDLRPQLAEKLRDWIRELIMKEEGIVVWTDKDK